MAWTIDTAHSTVSFNARHMGLAKVRGVFDRFDGEIEGDPQDITSARGRFDVDLASVDTGNDDRDAHLRSADFFDVEKHPKMTFVSKAIEPAGEGVYKVTGDLTIKGVTKPVELTYEHGGEGVDPFGNRKAGGTLSGTILRSDWGLTWNVALETGGWLVSDKVQIEVDLQVAESKEAVEQEARAEAETSA
jgi:polyisoprenoid-binding protein YceI